MRVGGVYTGLCSFHAMQVVGTNQEPMRSKLHLSGFIRFDIGSHARNLLNIHGS